MKKLMIAAAAFVAMSAQVRAEDRPTVITGRIVTEDGAREGWIEIDGGLIQKVEYGKKPAPANAAVIRTNAFIYPGLIDVHNHPESNSLPSVELGSFGNRYQWRNNEAYKKELRAPRKLLEKNGLYGDAYAYAQLRAVTGGVTAQQGYGPDLKERILIRSLEVEFGACDILEIGTHVDGATPEARAKAIADNAADIKKCTDGLDSGSVKRLFVHAAEGRRDDATSREEFCSLAAAGLLRPGVVVIHGTAFGPDQFQSMAENDMSLVWSPVSNLKLYGQTTDVVAAIEAGVTVALAPDWTESGSNNTLEEIKAAYGYAHENGLDGLLTPRQLFRMATVNAAKVAGAADKIGQIAPGFYADFFIARKKVDDPFANLLLTTPQDIKVVFVGGKPVYGDAAEMDKLHADNVQPVQDDSISSGKIVSMQKRLVLLRRALKGPDGKIPLAPLIETH